MQRLERWRVPRAVSVILIYAVSLLLVVGLLWFVTPPLFDQVAGLGTLFPVATLADGLHNMQILAAVTQSALDGGRAVAIA